MCIYNHIYILYIYLYTLYIYIYTVYIYIRIYIYIYVYIYIYLSLSLSVSLWVFRLLLCTGMRYTHRMYGYIQYIHVQSCILYIYICIYIYMCIAHMLALNHRKCLPHVLQPMALVNSRGTNRTCQQSSCLVPETMCQFSDSHHFAWQKNRHEAWWTLPSLGIVPSGKHTNNYRKIHHAIHG